jgi:hypothetical protein
MGFEVDPKLLTLAAKQLPHPDIFYGPMSWDNSNKNALYPLKKIDPPVLRRYAASWNLSEAGFAKPKGMNKLHLLLLFDCFPGLQDRGAQRATEIQTALVDQLRKHNVVVAAGDIMEQEHSRLEDELKAWYDSNYLGEDDCTLILLPDKSFTDYAAIKRAADLYGGKHTLCALVPKIQSCNEQYLSNLALKINIKLGGDNHHLSDQQLNQFLGEARRSRMMIMGADVTHPGKGSALGSPSIACVVGSVDGQFMNYPGSMRLQAGGQEVSTTFRR